MSTDYELRVEGRLRAPLTRHLDAFARTTPQCTVLRIQASQAELVQFLTRCQQAGIEVQRLRYAYGVAGDAERPV